MEKKIKNKERNFKSPLEKGDIGGLNKNDKSNYNKDLKSFARQLRKDSTLGEIILWQEVLRAKQMLGYQFNRQFPIKIDGLKIIVDFICRKLKLIIEIDGYSHEFKYEEDRRRDSILRENGYTILRIEEQEVRKNLDNVIRTIEFTIDKIKKQSPLPPSPRGSRG